MLQTEFEFVKSKMPNRPLDAHKGSMGTLLCVCGSYSMAGACILSAGAALRTGVGLVKVATVSELYPILAPVLPEAVFEITEEGQRFTLRSADKLLKACGSSDAVLVGCGLGTDEKTSALMRELITQINKPLLIDADGINFVSQHIFILEHMSSSDIVMTPHPKEMSRLVQCTVQEIQQERERIAFDFAKKYSLTLLLKGHKTVIARRDGNVYENNTGNPGLATGGSGDVLAGIISSLMAQGLSGSDAAVCGAYIHGRAADILAQKTSQAFLLPGDIVKNLYVWEK